jgi:IclR family transcriptional regulator, mhp operon transcriptional activator
MRTGVDVPVGSIIYGRALEFKRKVCHVHYVHTKSSIPVSDTYKSVRALTRGLDILLALNRKGRARPGELATETHIDRTTVYRLLHSLAQHGLVACSPADDSWYLLRGVQKLSDGYIENDRVLHAAARELGRMLPKVQWPSDFAIFDQGAMVIEETTHRFSPLSVHRNMVGRRRSLYNSALGRAALVGAPKTARSTMIELAEGLHAELLPNRRFIESLETDFDKRGYTWSVGGTEEKISAIAVPVIGTTRIIGAINIVFFRRAATPEKIADRFLDDLRQCANSIEDEIRHIS